MELTSLLLTAILMQAPAAAPPAAAQAAAGFKVDYIGGQPMPAKLTAGTLTLDNGGLKFQGGGAAISVPLAEVTKLRYGRVALKGVDKAQLVPELRNKAVRKRNVLDVQFTHKDTTSHLLLRLPPKEAQQILAQIEAKTGKKAELPKEKKSAKPEGKAGSGGESKPATPDGAGKTAKPVQTQPQSSS